MINFFHIYENPYEMDMYFFLKKFINIEKLNVYNGGFVFINHTDINLLYKLSTITPHVSDVNIICLYGWESYTDFNHLQEFYKESIRLGFNTERITVLYNNIYKFGINEYIIKKFGKIFTLSFPRMLFEKHFINKDEFTSIHNLRLSLSKNDYSCFNRIGRKHKQKTVNYISELGIDSYTTYKFPDGFEINKNAKLVNIKENEKEIPNHLEFYNGKVNICVETLYYDVDENSFENVVHLTEKIFRNVMLKIPFTLISNKNSLNRFRKLGFKTFDCVIDESYDTLEDSIRYKESIQSAKELLKFYNDKKVQDVLDYNFNLLIDKTNIHNKFDSLFLNPLKKHIKNLE